MLTSDHAARGRIPHSILLKAIILPLLLILLMANGPGSREQLEAGPGSTHHLVPQVMAMAESVPPSCLNPTIRFAVIGDYGEAGPDEEAVANLVKSWKPDFIVTTGDNNYPDGEAATIDANIGQYYREFIGNYQGTYGSGSLANRFWPSLGNHDWHTSSGSPAVPQPYLDYFDLPGNERYYQFVRGPVAFFALDSDSAEPDGRSSSSIQAEWLHTQLAASSAPWKLVYMHHAPYSSASHGPTSSMQWPYQTWGVTAVLAGHDHVYERIVRNGFPYFVNGLGGKSRYNFGPPISGSEVRYNEDFGAMRISANSACIMFEFVNLSGAVIDTYSLIRLWPALWLPLVRVDSLTEHGLPGLNRREANGQPQ